MTPKITNVIICEDVRQEVAGKASAMGMFSGNIQVGEMPAHIRLAFYFEIPYIEENIVLEIRIKIGKKMLTYGQFSLIGDKKNATIVFAQGHYPVERPSDIVVEAKFGDSNFKVIARKSIELGVASVEG